MRSKAEGETAIGEEAIVNNTLKPGELARWVINNYPEDDSVAGQYLSTIRFQLSIADTAVLPKSQLAAHLLSADEIVGRLEVVTGTNLRDRMKEQED